jgi:Family of unknown function (DUF6491)
MKRLALIAALASGVMTCVMAGTPSADKRGNACIFISSVGQYRSLDRDKIVIWAPGRRDAYLVELSMPLFGLENSWQMAMIDNDRDGRLCGFSMDRIGIRDLGRPESSSIKSMSRLTDEELGALEQQYNVQLQSKTKNNESDKT